MYIISKSDERKQREAAVLRTYHYSENAPAQIKEYAEGAAEGIRRALEVLGKEDR